jgi:ethanolaminephosphotransferase
MARKIFTYCHKIILSSLAHQLHLFFKGRLVIMLVDAMRYDFIFETDLLNEKTRMPFANRLIREHKALPFKLNARPPTVTLPRLKTIVSGIVPEFIDILWNFNTTQLVEDNILRKFKSAGKSILFYGDDTWLKLFKPSEYFLRYEGTTSFIASDFDEVRIP